MDDTDLLKMAGVSTSGLAIILIVYRVLKSVKGKRLVSSCCGKKIEVGIDVEEMTPKAIVIDNPVVASVAKPLPLRRSETTGVPTDK